MSYIKTLDVQYVLMQLSGYILSHMMRPPALHVSKLCSRLQMGCEGGRSVVVVRLPLQEQSDVICA